MHTLATTTDTFGIAGLLIASMTQIALAVISDRRGRKTAQAVSDVHEAVNSSAERLEERNDAQLATKDRQIAAAQANQEPKP